MQQHESAFKTWGRKVFFQLQYFGCKGGWDKTNSNFPSPWKSRVQMKCKQNWNGTLHFFFNLPSLERVVNLGCCYVGRYNPYFTAETCCDLPILKKSRTKASQTLWFPLFDCSLKATSTYCKYSDYLAKLLFRDDTQICPSNQRFKVLRLHTPFVCRICVSRKHEQAS